MSYIRPANSFRNSYKGDPMSFSRIFGNIEQNGIDLAANTRNRLRASFMAAKMSAKVQDWTKADDEAFDAIDTMTDKLVADAGFKPSLQALSKEFLEKQAEMRGLKLVPLMVAPQAPLAPAPFTVPPPLPPSHPSSDNFDKVKGDRPRVSNADKLESDISDTVQDRRAMKPQGFA